MPVYSPEQLIALKESSLVAVPEFKWNEIEKVPRGSNNYHENHSSGWRRGSNSGAKRPVVMPKAAIPFSQRALFENNKASDSQSAVEEDKDAELQSDDDEFAARYLLKNKPKAKKSQNTEEDGAPVVNLSYAAALAASMKMSQATENEHSGETAAEGDDDGWVSVNHQAKPRRNRNKGSFSKWRA